MINHKENITTLNKEIASDKLIEAMRREIIRLNGDVQALRKAILELQIR